MLNDLVGSIDFLMMAKLGCAVILALPIGLNRELKGPSVGLRTYPLVAVGSCAYVLVGIGAGGGSELSADASARLLQGLMTGIGFVGGGAILKADDRVRGTASAASVWVTGALGAALGFGQWQLAILLSLFNVVVVMALTRVKRDLD